MRTGRSVATGQQEAHVLVQRQHERLAQPASRSRGCSCVSIVNRMRASPASAPVASATVAAEVAIEVADDAQRQRIGAELAIRTLQRARANGFTHVTATTLHESAPARALLRALHFRPRSSHRHEIKFGLELHRPKTTHDTRGANHALQRHQDDPGRSPPRRNASCPDAPCSEAASPVRGRQSNADSHRATGDGS